MLRALDPVGLPRFLSYVAPLSRATVIELDQLQKIVPPPAKPKSVAWNDPAWLGVFDFFGTRLPEDFVQFHKIYGDGYFYSLTHRTSANLGLYGGIKSFDLNRQIPGRLTLLRLAKEKSARAVPFPLYCEPKGLLPWGQTTNDTDLCWEVSGELVDNWPVVVLRTASKQFERYDMGMAEFLLGLFARKFESALMPIGLPGAKGVAFEAC